uniref:LOW QUALITY PROTEIN: brevican core protein n=1 Tax=Gasterosteus aculeatus aculeatus TaxID=481459 RepID=UPI001A98EDE1|nr:LOW QUALITY PROTEIN: brevican core protein [Gasterosteus aculeatus aculeatus]
MSTCAQKMKPDVSLAVLLSAICLLCLPSSSSHHQESDESKLLQVTIPAPPPVGAVLGGSLTLPCLVSPAHPPPLHSAAGGRHAALSLPRVKWSVLINGNEAEILVARGDRVRVSEAYRDRATLLNYVSSPADLTLQLERLRRNDTGFYRCEVQQGLEDAHDVAQVKVKGVVFHYRDASSRYGFTFERAREACEGIGAEIASPEQLLAAYHSGYERCDAGWLADRSVRYPIQRPREQCFGDMEEFPGVRNYGLLDPDEMYDVYCYVENIHGEVFHGSAPQRFTFWEARAYCLSHGAELVTTAQLYAAWSDGLNLCSPGWLADGSVRYPIVTPRERCGGGEPGVRTVYRYGNQTGFPELHTRHDVYCFRGDDGVHTEPPLDFLSTEPEDIGQDIDPAAEEEEEGEEELLVSEATLKEGDEVQRAQATNPVKRGPADSSPPARMGASTPLDGEPPEGRTSETESWDTPAFSVTPVTGELRADSPGSPQGGELPVSREDPTLGVHLEAALEAELVHSTEEATTSSPPTEEESGDGSVNPPLDEETQGSTTASLVGVETTAASHSGYDPPPKLPGATAETPVTGPRGDDGSNGTTDRGGLVHPAETPASEVTAETPASEVTAETPGFRGHRRDPRFRSHRRDPRFRSHRRDPCFRGHRRDPRFSGHRRDPCFRSHRRDPRFRSHRRDPRFRGHRRDPRFRGHRRDPCFRSHRRDPRFRGHRRCGCKLSGPERRACDFVAALNGNLRGHDLRASGSHSPAAGPPEDVRGGLGPDASSLGAIKSNTGAEQGAGEGSGDSSGDRPLEGSPDPTPGEKRGGEEAAVRPDVRIALIPCLTVQGREAEPAPSSTTQESRPNPEHGAEPPVHEEREAAANVSSHSDSCLQNPCLNGGTCVEGGPARCFCLSGYGGDLCQTDLEACESGWDKFQGFCYRHFPRRQSWEAAEQHCRMCGGHLLSVTTPEEQDHVNDKYREYQWIGLNDRTIEGDFRWTDGKPLLYENWYHGQPDSYFLSGEDCAVMVWHDGGRWSDVPCNYHLSYTCKKGASSCGEPPEVPRATAFGKKRLRYETDTKVRYYCEGGYVQQGNPVVRCLPGGQWEEPLITCVPTRSMERRPGHKGHRGHRGNGGSRTPKKQLGPSGTSRGTYEADPPLMLLKIYPE